MSLGNAHPGLSLPHYLLWLALSTAVWAQPSADALQVSEDLQSSNGLGTSLGLQGTRPDIIAYRRLIERVESSEGAYAGALTEHLLSLGQLMQAQGDHEEAIDLFKRGVHLARINEGLYSAGQIPLLQGEINSHIASGDYESADDRQRYLYRVQIRSMKEGDNLATALMQHAGWQYQAYQLRLGSQDYARLMDMSAFYQLAAQDISRREGELSPNLLQPLYGRLQAQYLIADYDWGSQMQSVEDDFTARQRRLQFSAHLASNYRNGSEVISRIYSVEQHDNQALDEQILTEAEALVMLGDWQLYNEERNAAWEYYGRAFEELGKLPDAQAQRQAIFGAPVALPDLEGLRPLPDANSVEEGHILLKFAVTHRGKVVDVKRLDDNDALDSQAYRLMRKLRKTPFRPRF
ncbi:MAG: hypothetical protein AAGA91_09470, partial [Pseudomonadota bacterium]